MDLNQRTGDDDSMEIGEGVDEDEWRSLPTNAQIQRISDLPDKMILVSPAPAATGTLLPLPTLYGEKVEEKSALEEWICPKCRGICNCSVCMKRRGQKPTGKLVHTTKDSGFASASELLHGEGTIINEPSDVLLPKPETEKKKKRKLAELNEIEDFPMPRGTEMTSIAGVNLPPEDVGHALQFLEFCTNFKQVLNLKEGEPMNILLQLTRGEKGCRRKQFQVIRFHVAMLSMIHKNIENESDDYSSWLQALQNCLSNSQDLLEKLKLEGINLEVDEYESLSSSSRLRILTFLCDEVMCTKKFKKWIDDQNAKFDESQELLNERIEEAKQKKDEPSATEVHLY